MFEVESGDEDLIRDMSIVLEVGPKLGKFGHVVLEIDQGQWCERR